MPQNVAQMNCGTQHWPSLLAMGFNEMSIKALERVKERARGEENSIPLEYLKVKGSLRILHVVYLKVYKAQKSGFTSPSTFE